MRFRCVLTLAGLLLAAPIAPASVETLRKHVEFLASKDLAGRLTGTEGERLAAEYIERELERRVRAGEVIAHVGADGETYYERAGN